MDLEGEVFTVSVEWEKEEVVDGILELVEGDIDDTIDINFK